jgi:hypothetical protein
LVAGLLLELTTAPQPYGTVPPPNKPASSPDFLAADQDTLARAAQDIDASAPARQSTRTVSRRSDLVPRSMDFKIDFGDTAGFQTRGKKAAAKKKAQQSAFNWDEPEGNGDGPGNGEGGEGGDNAGDGGSGAGGAGGDDGNGGGGDDDWTLGFSSKKDKKKSKKKQEEEEQKKQEEDDAAAASATNALNWADDTNDAAGDDDWTAGFTTAGKKGKKGKKVRLDGLLV